MFMNGRIFVAVAAAGALMGACMAAAPLMPAPGGSAGAVTTPAPKLAGCPMLPANNPWNQNVTSLAPRADSSTLIANISSPGQTNLHPDFGGAGAYGIPF